MAIRRRKKPKPRRAVKTDETREQPWSASRAGARAGRGFRYQDVVGGALLVSMWAGERDPAPLVPEGHDDMVLEGQFATLFLQVKSRQPHRGSFPKGRIADELVTAWHRNGPRLRRDPDRLVLVVEQPYGNLEPGEHAVDGADFDEVHTLIRSKLSADEATKLIDRSEVWIWPDPQSSAITCLAERLGLPDQVCGAHFNALRQHLGNAEDSNASATEDQRHALSPTDVTRIIDEVTNITDPSSLQEALSLGLCEAVGFLAPDHDEQFYIGTDVTPGHVAAGLPHPRVEVERVAEALDDDRPVLVAGPSGSGKSAVLWMSAYRNRGTRWYRVNSCSTPEHVSSLMHLAQGLLPTRRTPIGFVIDNVGRPGTEAWDQLVAESAMVPGIHLVGAVREEDLFQVGSLSEVHLVRLSMDEALAEEIWSELNGRGWTSSPHWREPFDTSHGLLLEFMHILSKGSRLRDVVADQVRSRREEKRYLELSILGITSVANSYAVEVPLAPLLEHLGESEEAVSAALDRLTREHLILRDESGDIRGLHTLRSVAISEAIHDRPPPAQSVSICRASSLLTSLGLRTFLVGVLTDLPSVHEDLLRTLAMEALSNPSPTKAIAILHALRTAEFVNEAHRWADVFEDVGVPMAMRSIAGTFVLMATDLSSTQQLWDPRILLAVDRIRDQAKSSTALRTLFLSHLPREWLSSLLSGLQNCQLATELLTTVNVIETTPLDLLDGPILTGSPLAKTLAEATIEEAAGVLSAARGVSLETAEHLADCLGGPDVLLERIRDAVPWCQSITAGTPSAVLLDDNDESFEPEDLAARIEYRFISDQLTPNPHDTVVRLSALVFACHPRVEVVRAVTLDARNQPYGVRGHEMASKRLRRRALPPASEIAWNRLRMRIVAGMVASDTLTDRIVSELRLTDQVMRLVRRVATIWLTGHGNSAVNLNAIDESRRALIDDVDQLPPVPLADDGLTGPLDQGVQLDNDPLHSVLRSCLREVIDSLAADKPNHFRTSAQLTRLISQIAEIAADGRWQLIGLDGVPDELSNLLSLLADLRETSSVLAGDPAWGKRALDIANKSRRNAVPTLAKAAKQRGLRKLQTSIEAIRSSVERPGVLLNVATREDSDNGLINPRTELLLMLEVESLEVWTEVADDLAEALQRLGELRSIWVVPVVQGYLVAIVAMKLHNSKLWPIAPGWDNWDKSIPPQKKDPPSEAFSRIWSTATELSALAGYPVEEGGDIESRAAEGATLECQEAYKTLLSLVQANPSSMILQEVGEIATWIVEAINLELEAGSDESGAIAAMALDMADGQQSELAEKLTGAWLLLAEYAIRPSAAELWYERLTAAD